MRLTPAPATPASASVELGIFVQVDLLDILGGISFRLGIFSEKRSRGVEECLEEERREGSIVDL